MRRTAFTLVELLTVITIIGILVGMLMPAMNVAREAARSAQCSSNLRQFGVAFAAHSSANRGRLCTGGFDWERDGSVIDIGWVADLVNNGQPVGSMRCPSNSAELSETINQLMTVLPPLDSGGKVDTTCVDWVGSENYLLPDSTQVKNPCRVIAELSIPPGHPDRAELVRKRLLDKFYNTNYAASWFLVRSSFELQSNGAPKTNKTVCGIDPRGRNVTDGPLEEQEIDSAKAPSSIIPLLGDARPVGLLESPVSDSLIAGSFLAANIFGGPVLSEPVGTQVVYDVPVFASTTPMNGPGGWWEVWNKKVLQDYRRLYPLHRNRCNVLMADGGVRAIYDSNRDGFVNNGFQQDKYFKDSEIEVSVTEIFSLYNLRSKGQ